jgi:hypothetical protein
MEILIPMIISPLIMIMAGFIVAQVVGLKQKIIMITIKENG